MNSISNITSPAGSEVQFSITTGASKTTAVWETVQSYSFAEFADILRAAPVGAKDGLCYTPAVFRGTERKMHHAARIGVVVLDSDCGHSLDEIRVAIEARGWCAIIHSTHSHAKNTTEIAAGAARKWLAENPDKGVADYMTHKSGYLPRVVEGAEIVGDDGKNLTVRHQPCPKFRIILPLAAAWVATPETQIADNDRWRERIGALAHALGLNHDQSCSDTSRLFYFPRVRDEAARLAHVCEFIAGAPCPLDALPAVPDDSPLFNGGRGTASHGGPSTCPDYVSTDGEIFSLKGWMRGDGRYFEVVKAIRARAPVLLAPRPAGVKQHIYCPNSEMHVTGGTEGTGTFCVNASDLSKAGLPSIKIGFVIHCSHNGCTGLDRLDQVRALLTKGNLSVEDLTNPEFLAGVPNDIDFKNLNRGRQGQQGGSSGGTGGAGAANGAASGGKKPANAVQAGINAVVEEFNARYKIVNENGKAVIFQEEYDASMGRMHIIRLGARDLAMLYMNKNIVVQQFPDGRIKSETASHVWMNHPNRLEYIRGVVFDPNATNDIPGVLNLWKGFYLKPAAGSWEKMKSHIKDVICKGNEGHYNYLMGWMARMLQKPGSAGETAVVMRSGEGTGKGILASALVHIIGQHALTISQASHLVGNFNSHLRDVILLFADEAFFAGDKKHTGALKALITGKYLTIEGKGQNIIETPNYLHVMMASNEDWVVPASLDARRFFVLDVSEEKKGNIAYFKDIIKELESGGYEAMMHDLLAVDISDFDVRTVPVTEGLQRQKSLSLPITKLWWKSCLERGYVWRSKLGLEKHFGFWMQTISTDLLHDSYLEFAKSHGERRPLTREYLGRFLRTVGGEPVRISRPILGEHMTDVLNEHGRKQREAAVHRVEDRVVDGKTIQGRGNGYVFGKLPKARTDFCKALKLQVEWDADSDVEPDDGWPGPR